MVLTVCEPDQVTISARVVDPSGVSGVKLTYRVVDGGEEGAWQADGMSETGGGTYAFTVEADDLEASLNPPVSTNPGTLEYYVQAFDGIGNRSESTTETVTVNPCIY